MVDLLEYIWLVWNMNSSWPMADEWREHRCGVLQKITSGVICEWSGFVLVCFYGIGWWLGVLMQKWSFFPPANGILWTDVTINSSFLSSLSSFLDLSCWERTLITLWSEEKQSICFHMAVAVTRAPWLTLCISESEWPITNLKCIN